ncbi:stress response small protein YobI, partial [Escherichia coli]
FFTEYIIFKYLLPI